MIINLIDCFTSNIAETFEDEPRAITASVLNQNFLPELLYFLSRAKCNPFSVWIPVQRTRARSRGTSSRSSWASTRRFCPKPTAPAARPCWSTRSSKWTIRQDSGPASRNTNPSPTLPEGTQHAQKSTPQNSHTHTHFTHTKKTRLCTQTFGPNGCQGEKESSLLPKWRASFFVPPLPPFPLLLFVFKSAPVVERCGFRTADVTAGTFERRGKSCLYSVLKK